MNNKRILLVEDDYAIRKVLTRFLESEGYQVSSASTTWEAIDLVVTLKGFHLLVVDLQLPQELNLPTPQFLLELSRFLPAVPLIGMSTTAGLVTSHPQLKAVLQKPFQLAELSATVKQVGNFRTGNLDWQHTAKIPSEIAGSYAGV